MLFWDDNMSGNDDSDADDFLCQYQLHFMNVDSVDRKSLHNLTIISL